MAKISTGVFVYGMVQGVGFRYTAQMQAKSLGLTGFARNLDDGSVEMEVCGESEQVEKFLRWLKQSGPRSAHIDRMLTEPRSLQHYQGFEIRH